MKKKTVYSGNFDEKSLRDWILLESLPLISEFKQSSRIFGSSVKTHFFLFLNGKEGDTNTDAKKILSTLAPQFKGKVVFTYVDVSTSESNKISEYFGIKAGETSPQIRVFTISENPRKYKPEFNDVNAKLWEDYLNEILDGKRPVYFKSEEPVEYSGKGVRVVVGKDHENLVKNPSLNVFVEYYAPWCGYCKNLEPKWTELAEIYDEIPNLVIAKMDWTNNEAEDVAVSGFPTLFFYPATTDGSAKGPGIKYEGSRELDDLKKFVERHGVNIPSHPSKITEEEGNHDEL